jgi:hypothetical protein
VCRKSNITLPDTNHFDTLRKGKTEIVWKKYSSCLTFEVLTAIIMRIVVSWDETQCNPATIYQCFGETCYLHHQGGRELSESPMEICRLEITVMLE